MRMLSAPTLMAGTDVLVMRVSEATASTVNVSVLCKSTGKISPYSSLPNVVLSAYVCVNGLMSTLFCL